MKKRVKRRRASIPTKTAHSVLAEEVKQIEAGGLAGARFTDAPSALPRAAEAQRISIRLPVRLLAILKAATAEVGVDYQVVLKRWL
jgi:predicted DNA binding CopG/RHH family protein